MAPTYSARPVGINNGASTGPTNVRSNSAIDLQAASRAVRNIRGGYVAPLRNIIHTVQNNLCF